MRISDWISDVCSSDLALGLRLKGDVADIHEDEPSPVSLIGLLASLPNDAAGLRDRAMISTGYDAGLRRSELVRIDLKHIERLPTGEAALFVPRSKTDQEGGRPEERREGKEWDSTCRSRGSPYQ